jgi:hypothetical protein
LLDATVEGLRERVPEVEEGVFLEADVDEHGLEAMLDILHAALEDAADNVAVRFALDGVFLENAALEESDPPFQFFAVNNELVAGLARCQADQSFDTFGHGNEFGVKL